MVKECKKALNIENIEPKAGLSCAGDGKPTTGLKFAEKKDRMSSSSAVRSFVGLAVIMFSLLGGGLLL